MDPLPGRQRRSELPPENVDHYPDHLMQIFVGPPGIHGWARSRHCASAITAATCHQRPCHNRSNVDLHEAGRPSSLCAQLWIGNASGRGELGSVWHRLATSPAALAVTGSGSIPLAHRTLGAQREGGCLT